MRAHEPVCLALLDPDRAAIEVMQLAHRRACNDALRLGLTVAVIPLTGPQDEAAIACAIASSKVYRNARACADWATTGQGKPERIAGALRRLRGDIYGADAADVLGRTPDLRTMSGVLVVATSARLTLHERRAVDAVELATLASVDERTIRATVKAGRLQPLGPGRPMRFAPDVARRFLVGRSVRGFEASPAPAADLHAPPGQLGVTPFARARALTGT